jgi:hypothetical protein
MDNVLSDLLDYCKSNNKVCPQPMLWNQLWELLPDRKRDGLGWKPSLPLILAAWWETTDEDKLQRLIEHIQWAHDHGGLEKVNQHLRSLSEDQWHHIGE